MVDSVFEVQDAPAIAAVAHAHGAKVLMDNTWASTSAMADIGRHRAHRIVHFLGRDYGVDVSIHAATKYIAGHSDALLGACADRSGDLNIAVEGCAPSPGHQGVVRAHAVA